MGKKIVLFLMALALMCASVACGNKHGEDDTQTNESIATEGTEEPSSALDDTEEPTSTPEETEEPSSMPEETEEQKPESKPETKPTPTPEQKPESKPETKPTPTPTPTEAPIVQKNGNVDNATYEKAVKAFEGIVKKMRTDGLVKSSDVCVTMDNSNIKVDITFDNDDIDLMLSKDNSTNVYTLTFDYNFTWLEGFGPKVNGKDPALYNKELLIAILGMVSNEPKVVFDRIDLDCFSAAGLYVDEWTEIADCFIMSGEMKVDEFISYKLTKEDVDKRNATCVLTGKTVSGATIECIIEYDSSKVTFKNNNGKLYMSAVDESKIGPNGYPVIGTGCTSYDNYKKSWVDKHVAKGDANAHITEYNSHRVNGFTYYWFEGFYKTETEIGDPDVIYVQISEQEYIEIYNILFEERFEDFINSSFYIKEVKIK